MFGHLLSWFLMFVWSMEKKKKSHSAKSEFTCFFINGLNTHVLKLYFYDKQPFKCLLWVYCGPEDCRVAQWPPQAVVWNLLSEFGCEALWIACPYKYHTGEFSSANDFKSLNTQDFIFEQPRLSVFVFATVNKHGLLADTSGLLLPWPGFYLSMKQMISKVSLKRQGLEPHYSCDFLFFFFYTFPFPGLMDEIKECFGLAIDSDNICCCC